MELRNDGFPSFLGHEAILSIIRIASWLWVFTRGRREEVGFFQNVLRILDGRWSENIQAYFGNSYGKCFAPSGLTPSMAFALAFKGGA
jgi:hypothetical protein